MSGTSAFAKTTEPLSLKEKISFEDAVKEADETSDYARINMAMKLMNVSISSGFNKQKNEDEINRLAKRAMEYPEGRDPVKIITSARMHMKNAYAPNISEAPADLRAQMNEFTDYELERNMGNIEKEISQMAESKYNLTTPEKNVDIVFSDVNDESWYYDAVTKMTSMGLFNGKTESVNGIGTFAPDDIITRSLLLLHSICLLILCRMIFDGVKLDVENKWYHTDLWGNNKTEIETPWYGDYYTILVMNDVSLPAWLLEGVSDTQVITRGNMATLIARAIHVSRCWSDTLYDDMNKD